MIPIAFQILALLTPLAAAMPQSNAQPPSNQNPQVLGSNESTPPRHIESSGFTLDKLHGLPRIREVRVPPQPEIWVYPQYMGVYPGNSYQYGQYGLGGYRPPGTGGYSAPWPLIFFR